MGVLSFSAFLGLELIFFCILMILLSVYFSKETPLGIYCLMSLFVFSMLPFFHDA